MVSVMCNLSSLVFQQVFFKQSLSAKLIMKSKIRR